MEASTVYAIVHTSRSAPANDYRCAIAVTKLLAPILEQNGLPGAAMSLVCGDVDVGKSIVGSKDVDLCQYRHIIVVIVGLD